jgi:hypothetical protein
MKVAQYQITLDSEILQQLFLSDSKESGVNKLLESVLNQVLKAQVTEQISAEHYQRTDDRKSVSQWQLPTPADYQSRNHYPACAEAQGWQILYGDVQPLPAQRTGLCPSHAGDGNQRGLDSQNQPDY